MSNENKLIEALREAIKWADQDCPKACMNAVQRARHLLPPDECSSCGAIKPVHAQRCEHAARA